MKLSLLIFSFFIFFLTSLSLTEAALSYAIVHADNANYVGDVQKKLIPLLGNVSLVNVMSNTPSLTQLSSYDALLVYSNFAFADPVALGNVIASYVDLGKGVVVAMFALSTIQSNLYCLTGRFLGTGSNTYYVITPAFHTSSPALTLVPVLANHSILNGVVSFNGGSYSYRSLGNWTADATPVALWSDRTPLIGTRAIHGTRRVDLNFYPVSSDAFAGFWVASTDGAKILANSLSWVAASMSCYGYKDCVSCSSSDCLWCLDSNECAAPDFICPNRIVRPGDCPAPSCSQFNRCSSCLGSGVSCSWCLDNSTCVIKNSPCKGELNDGKFCSSLF